MRPRSTRAATPTAAAASLSAATRSSRRPLSQLQSNTNLAPAVTSSSSTSSPNRGAAKSSNDSGSTQQTYGRGKDKENPTGQQEEDTSSYGSSASRRENAVDVHDDDEAEVVEEEEDDNLQVDEVASLALSSRLASTFVPVPLVHPPSSSSSARSITRVARDVGPSSGRIERPQSAGRTLFPPSSSSIGGGTSINTSNAPSTATSLDVTLLQHGLTQILSTKDNAKRYIEMLRKKMYQYMILNKEYASTHAAEQLRNKGVITLKKTLQARIEQLEGVQKNIVRQVGQREAEAQKRIDALQQELNTFRERHVEAQQAQREAERTVQMERKEHERELKKLRSEYVTLLEEAQHESSANASKLKSALSHSESEKEKLQQQVDQLEADLSEAKVQLRVKNLSKEATTASSAASADVEHTQRLEVGLEHACEEIDHLQSESQSNQRSLAEAVQDIQVLVEKYDRLRRTQAKLLTEAREHEDEYEAMVQRVRSVEIDLAEATDISEAYRQAYESTLRAKEVVQQGLSQLIAEFGMLRDQLVELLVEQGGTIPLPLEALDSHPDLSIMLSSAAIEANEAEKESEMINSSAAASPPARTDEMLSFTLPSSSTSSSMSYGMNSSLLSPASDTSRVIRRLSMNVSPDVRPQPASAVSSSLSASPSSSSFLSVPSALRERDPNRRLLSPSTGSPSRLFVPRTAVENSMTFSPVTPPVKSFLSSHLSTSPSNPLYRVQPPPVRATPPKFSRPIEDLNRALRF